MIPKAKSGLSKKECHDWLAMSAISSALRTDPAKYLLTPGWELHLAASLLKGLVSWYSSQNNFAINNLYTWNPTYANMICYIFIILIYNLSFFNAMVLTFILTVHLSRAVCIYNYMFFNSAHLHGGWDISLAIVLSTFQYGHINVYYSSKYNPFLKNSWLQQDASLLQVCASLWFSWDLHVNRHNFSGLHRGVTV